MERPLVHLKTECRTLLMLAYFTITTDMTILPCKLEFWLQTNFEQMLLFLGDGSIGLEEFRYDCVNRMPVSAVKLLDDAFRQAVLDAKNTAL